MPCESMVEIYSKRPDPEIGCDREIQIYSDDEKYIKIMLRIFWSLMFFRGVNGESIIQIARTGQVS
ncbi:hypothetical protein RvY_14474 [Ramazzottius varieornatus]|uniref:Uncharacterized protein n=1 Tax=Ramazzottius varieornatus TaxID=947166 RepID=A0A1D1VRF9_RAMVA|nr:hypothetical protein RvY_14474 [Ramazzottius varieornatus]